MSDEELLTAAREYCDPETGEVIKRIPEALMRKLRDANLARGIRGKRSTKTDTSATWFVFLDAAIRDARLLEWRESNKRRKQIRPT